MNIQQQPQQITLQPKTPIKNLHQVRQLSIHNNSQIFIVYNSIIHIHSMQKMLTYLPSLIYAIDLQNVAGKIDRQKYQDGFSRSVASSDKTGFGEIVFGADMDQNTNKLLDVRVFRDRVKYLDGNCLRVKNFSISPAGHILILFQDNRCIVIKRNNPLSINISYSNLYNTQSPILVNHIVEHNIKSIIFLNSIQISLLSLHEYKRGGSLGVGICRLADGKNRDKNGDKGENGFDVYTMAQMRKLKIVEKGFRSMSFVDNASNSGNGWILLLYYDRLEIVQIGKINHKNRTFQLISHKLADFNSEQGSIQHVMDSWQHMFYHKQEHKIVKLYLLKSASIWELEITFILQPNEKDKDKLKGKQKQRQKTQSSWYYKLKKLQKQRQISPKSNIFYINQYGDYLQNKICQESYPNHQLNLAVETDNGLLIRLQSNAANYKEGYLFIVFQSAVCTVEKSLQSLRAKSHGDRLWVNFNDLCQLKKHQQIKKSILKQLTKAIKTKQKQQCHTHLQQMRHPSVQDSQSALTTKIIINILSSLQSKTHLVQKLTHETIRKHLKLKQNENFDLTHCVYTNKRIITEDVLFCRRCHLYVINPLHGNNEDGSRNQSRQVGRQILDLYCCYICWNPLFDIQ